MYKRQVDGGIVDVTPTGCSVLVERAEDLNGIDKTDIEKRYNSFKEKEDNFENPAEEKANSEEISWLRFVLDNIKN